MQQFDDSRKTSRLDGKSATEIVEMFKSYNFVDDHGHRLDTCEEFIDLVDVFSSFEK